MSNQDFLQLSAIELGQKMAQGLLRAEDVVGGYVERQRKLNPALNAVVENRWEQAIDEAREKDKQIASGYRVKPNEIFWGVPFTVKEMITVDGMRQTLGSIHRKNETKDYDASIVARMKAAGGVVVGTTNVPELGFWFECENPVYGWTRNPYDYRRTSGGSSGGEAACLGAGASVIGLGSDVGGSVRMPAGFCGVFGHKPSNRIVPITGHYPVEKGNAKNFKDPRYPLTVLGPLARKATDLRPMLETIMGPDGVDPEVKSFSLKPADQNWQGKTVWVLPNPHVWGVSRCAEEVTTAVELAGQYFESIGARVRRMRFDYFKEAVVLWSTALNQVEGRKFEDELFSTSPPSLLAETVRSMLSPSGNYSIPALATVAAERLLELSKDHWQEPSQHRFVHLQEMLSKLTTLFGDDSILIFPTHPRLAPFHHGTYTRPFDFAMTGIFNALGLPATVAPVSWHEGLPVSVQCIASWGNDHLTLSAAETLEFAFGGWKPPNNTNTSDAGE